MVWRPEAKTHLRRHHPRRTCALGAGANDALHDGSISRALAAHDGITIVLAGTFAFSTGRYQGTRADAADHPVPLIGFVLLIVATGCMVVFHRLRLMALVLVGIIGLIVSCGSSICRRRIWR
jgi:multicomponent K+:H+ antiporter subunit A